MDAYQETYNEIKEDFQDIVYTKMDMILDNPAGCCNRWYSKKFSELEKMFFLKWMFRYNELLYENEKDKSFQRYEYELYGKASDILLRPQYKCGKYKIDFVIKKKKIKIAIELDGFNYHDRDKKQFNYERKRQNYLTKNGYIILRYTWDDIKNNFYDSFNEIMGHIDDTYHSAYLMERKF
jgi:very-short-patch-repair endonuclease